MPSFKTASRPARIQLSEVDVEFKADVVVLGAGMVGVCAALHLQQRGRDVILLDRHELAGQETSYGNAGLMFCKLVTRRKGVVRPRL
jgi:ribulose 1,5-bisphosphate synthetase/thiazole synthase